MLLSLGVRQVAAAADPRLPVRAIGGYLVVTAGVLAAVWLVMWAAHVFGGWALPIGPEPFKVVAALDLTLLVLPLAIGGLLLWRRRPWGVQVATFASVQGALYLLVLTVNSANAIRHGQTEPPGELPVWGTLLALTSLSAVGLIGGLRASPPGR